MLLRLKSVDRSQSVSILSEKHNCRRMVTKTFVNYSVMVDFQLMFENKRENFLKI